MANKRIGDVIYDNFDQYTGQPFNTKVLTHLPDGTEITDALVDNAVVFKNKVSQGGGYSIRSEFLEKGEVNVSWLGAVGDGVTDELNSFRLASSVAQSLNSPISIPSQGEYFISGQVDLYTPIKGDNSIIKGGGNGSLLFVVRGSNVTIEGLDVEMFLTGPSESAPTAITYPTSATDVISNLTIQNNRFVNCRCTIRNSNVDYIEGVTISNNRIECNFQGVPLFNVQNDIFNFQGVKDLKITGNSIVAVETNRVVKIQSSIASDLSTGSDSIIISNNYIEAVGRTTPGDVSKQVFDLFSNSGTVIFSNNIVKAKDYSSILEDKTSSFNSYKVRSYIISNNILENNHPAIYITGSYSRVGYSDDERDYTIVKSTNNIFNHNIELSNTDRHPICEYRFLDELFISGDTYKDPEGLSVSNANGVSTYNIDKLTIESSSFQNNIPSIGTIGVFLGIDYTPKYGVINFVNNIVSLNASGLPTTLFITGQSSLQGSIEHINISNNFLNNSQFSTSFRPIRVTYLDVNQGSILNNKTNSTNAGGVLSTGSIFNTRIQYGNTWTLLDSLPFNIEYFPTNYSSFSSSQTYNGNLDTIPKGSYSAVIGGGASNIPSFIGTARGIISFGNTTNGAQILIGVNRIGYRQWSGASVFGAWIDLHRAATGSVVGSVLQSTSVSDVTPPTVTTIEEANTAIQALVSKVNELLQAERDSGQMST